MTTVNRIVKVEITLTGDRFQVAVTKEFEAQYGGGSQVFLEDGGGSLHYALDVARGMVTLSPGARTDLPAGSCYEKATYGSGSSVADFEPNPATNRRQA